MSEDLELLSWEDVETVLLVDNKGTVHGVTKEELVAFLRPYIQDALTELWEGLAEE